jgi:hypothetical protein
MVPNTTAVAAGDEVIPSVAPRVQDAAMPHPYGDPMKIVTKSTLAQSPFIPVDSKIMMGAVDPAFPDPTPIVLLPGFECRLREWRHPDTHEVHWLLERRKSAQQGDNDE